MALERTNLSAELETELKAMIADGRKVAAIKRYREATGCGLADANNWLVQTLAAGGFVVRRPGKPCPYCGQPLRTDVARQCFECGTDWHDLENVVRRESGSDSI